MLLNTCRLPFVLLLISLAFTAQAGDVRHFSVGGGVGATWMELEGLPGEEEQFEKRIDGFHGSAGFYFTDWFGIEARYSEKEDIDIIFDDLSGDIDLRSDDLMMNFTQNFNGTIFFMRGKLGVSRWRADGYSEYYSYYELDELPVQDRSGEWDLAREGHHYGFSAKGTDIFAGIGLGFTIARRVEFYFGYEMMKTDAFEAGTFSFSTNVRI